MESFTNMRDALKQTLDEDLSEAVQQIIQKHLMHQECQNAIAINEVESMVCREVITSETFNRLKNDICINLCYNKFVRQEKDMCSCRLSLHSLLYSGSDMETDANNMIETVVESLLCSSPACKLQVLETLKGLLFMEQVTLMNWKQCENGLQSCLHHPLSVISEASLAVYVSALCSSSPYIIRESYISLLKVTSKILSENMLKSPDLNLTCAHNVITVTNNFQKTVSKHWLRYPEEIIRSLVEETLEHFSLNSSYGVLSTLYGLIDPPSQWLCNWLYCIMSRLFVCKSIGKHRQLVLNLLEICNVFLSDEMKNDRSALQASHAVSFLMNLASYEEGMRLISQITHEPNPSGSLWVLLFNVTLNLNTSAINDAFEKLFPNIFLLSTTCTMSCENYENVKKIVNMIENVSSRDDPSKMCLLSKCLKQISDIGEGKQLFLDKPELFQAIKQYITGALALEPCKRKVIINFLHVLKNFLHHDKGTEMILKGGFTYIFVKRFRDIIPSDSCDFLIAVLCCPMGPYYCYNIREEVDICTMLIKRCEAFIKDSCTVCSFEDAKTVCKLLTFYLLKTNDYEGIFHFYIKLWSVTENCCICFGLDSSTHLGTGTLERLRKLSIFFESFIHVFSMSISKEKYFKEVFFIFENMMSCSNCGELIILHTLTACLNSLRTCFCLSTMFDIREFIIRKQKFYSEEGKIQSNEATMMQNHVLARTLILGGPNERTLPQSSIESDKECIYPFILSESIPINPEYSEASSKASPCNSKFSQLVNDLNSMENFLLGNLKTECVIDKINFTTLEKIFQEVVVQNTEHAGNHVHVVSDVMEVGLEKSVAYGMSCQMLSVDISATEHKENMRKLLYFANSTFKLDTDPCDLFNFLAASIYIIAAGKEELARKLVVFRNKEENGINSFGEMFEFIITSKPCYQKGKLCMFFDVIVEEMLPDVYGKLIYCGIRPSDLWLLWTGQVFWNYLDIHDIGYFVLLCTLCGAENALYFSVGVLNFWRKEILQCLNSYELDAILRKNSFKRFYIFQELPFINLLRQQYESVYERIIVPCTYLQT